MVQPPYHMPDLPSKARRTRSKVYGLEFHGSFDSVRQPAGAPAFILLNLPARFRSSRRKALASDRPIRPDEERQTAQE